MRNHREPVRNVSVFHKHGAPTGCQALGRVLAAPGRIGPSLAVRRLHLCGRHPPAKPTRRECDLCESRGHHQTRGGRHGTKETGFPEGGADRGRPSRGTCLAVPEGLAERLVLQLL